MTVRPTKVRNGYNSVMVMAHLELYAQNTRMILKLYHGVLLLLSNVCPLHDLERVKLRCTSRVLETLSFQHQNLCKDRAALLTVAQLGIKVRCRSASM